MVSITNGTYYLIIVHDPSLWGRMIESIDRFCRDENLDSVTIGNWAKTIGGNSQSHG